MISFEEKEVIFECNEATGKLKLSISTDIIMEKLKKVGGKVSFKLPYISREDVEKEYFPKLSKVNYSTFLAMNFEQTKSKKRSLFVYARILNDLVDMVEKYGPDQVNEAISKCNIPKKCTIPYLKAILGNNQSNYRESPKDDRIYQRNIEEALRHFM